MQTIDSVVYDCSWLCIFLFIKSRLSVFNIYYLFYLCTWAWRCECPAVRSGRNSTRVESMACTRWIDPTAEIGCVLPPNPKNQKLCLTWFITQLSFSLRSYLVTEWPQKRTRISRKKWRRLMQVRRLMTTILLEFALFGSIALLLDFHYVIDPGSRRVIQDSWWFVVDRPTDHPIRQLKQNQKRITQLWHSTVQQHSI